MEAETKKNERILAEYKANYREFIKASKNFLKAFEQVGESPEDPNFEKLMKQDFELRALVFESLIISNKIVG